MPDLTRKVKSVVMVTMFCLWPTVLPVAMQSSPSCLRHPLHCAAQSEACCSSRRGPMVTVHGVTWVFVVHFDLGAHSAALAAV